MTSERFINRARRAFTLIEVLIAVLVLALGLLGLAAVFPAVIAQQRDAVDRTQGAVVAKVVEQTLENAQFFVDFQGLRRDSWFSADTQLQCGEGFDLDTQNMSFLWEPSWGWGPAGHMDDQTVVLYLTQGTIGVGFGDTIDLSCSTQTPAPEEEYYIPVTARLYPPPYSGSDPQYVWDFVPRRTRLAGGSTGLELAVFIRRIDPRIRVPRGKTLSDVLTGGNGVGIVDARLPLGVDPVSQRPTGTGAPVNGTGFYSIPLTLPVLVNSGALDEIVLDASAGASGQDLWKQAVASPGQILVDNLGNVLHVVRVPERRAGDPLRVQVDHRYAVGEADYVPGNGPAGERGVRVEQIVFTLNKPVRVFTYRANW